MGNPLEGISFHALFDVAADAQLLADETGHIVAANPAALKLFAYSPEEILNLPVEMLMPERFRHNHRKYRDYFSLQPEKRGMGGGKPLVALCRDGREVTVNTSLTPLQSIGRPCVLITFYDASDHIKVQNALRLSEAKLVDVMLDINEHRAKERRLRDRRAERESLLSQQVAILTAAAIAHELNQPLAAVSAYSEVALHEVRNANASGKLSHALESCVEQAQRAGSKLHDLLEFLQKLELTRAPMDINEAVREAISVEQNDGLGGFHSILELEQYQPLVLANRIQVQRVLTNLIRNAVEAARDAGMPGSIIKVKVQTTSHDGLAQVTVQDNGPGLDTKTLTKIFDPFFTTKSRGIGMGLAVSRALVNANGGKLWAELNQGSGATFHFTLPFLCS